MKQNLRDVTFIMLVRQDSVQRIENTIAVTNYLLGHFHTRIHLLEASAFDNGILRALLGKKTDYRFVEDKDPLLHKTKYYNEMVRNVETPLLAIWDTDVIADKDQIMAVTDKLRSGEADMGYPYSGVCLETPPIIRELFLRTKNIRTLDRHKGKMVPLHNKPLCGGAVMADVGQYRRAGMENESYYGWGNEDFDRLYRWQNLAMKIYRTPNPLYHLLHPRGGNSQYISSLRSRLSTAELERTLSGK